MADLIPNAADAAPAQAGADHPPVSLSTSVRLALTGCPETAAPAESPPKAKDITPAQWMYLRLAQAIAAFEKTLDAEHEVGLTLVSFGAGQVLHVESLGYWAPDLVLFFGRNGDGAPVQMLQHVTQVSLLLAAAPKQTAQPRRIGFEILKQAQAEAGLDDGG